MQTLHAGIISIPGSSNTWTWKLPPIWAIKVTKQITNMCPRWVPGDSNNFTKMDKQMDTWTSRCLLGVLVDPLMTKMFTQGTQNVPSRSPK